MNVLSSKSLESKFEHLIFYWIIVCTYECLLMKNKYVNRLDDKSSDLDNCWLIDDSLKNNL